MKEKGVTIAQNAKKVGSYMEKLQSYLEGVDGGGGSGRGSLASSDREEDNSVASIDSMNRRADSFDGAEEGEEFVDDPAMSLHRLARLGGV